MKLLVTVILLSLLAFSCSKSEQPPTEQEPELPDLTKSEPSANEIVSDDGISKIVPVGSWQKAKGLHKKAQLQASNPLRDLYLIAFSEKREKYAGMTLQEHSQSTRTQLIKTLKFPVISGPFQIQIDGQPALQYEIHGMASNNMKIAYYHTDVNSPLYFHEIIAWTTDSRFKENKTQLQNVIKTFKEVEAQAPATP